MKLQGVQYTIRGVPGELDQALRDKANREGSSLNHVVIEVLSRAVLAKDQKADFSDLVGTWIEDKGFDEIIEDFRTIHPDDWK